MLTAVEQRMAEAYNDKVEQILEDDEEEDGI